MVQSKYKYQHQSMDQVYVLVNSSEVCLSRSFVQHHENHLTPVFVEDQIPCGPLTKEAIEHQQRLQDISETTFPTTFFAERYLNARRAWSSNEVWEQWKRRIGSNQLNPYDRQSLILRDLPLIYALIGVLYDALQNHYKCVLILNAIQKIPLPDLWNAMNHFETVIKKCEICFFSYKEDNYGYLLRSS